MFGVSFGEVLLIAVVALVVVGPRKLPEYLGTLGKWINKVRRITTEMRAQTGIDEILRSEGLAGGLSELRSMLRPPDLSSLTSPRFGPGAAAIARADKSSAVDAHGEPVEFDRYREYPTEGSDAHGAIPEDLLDSPALAAVPAGPEGPPEAPTETH